MHTYTHAHIYGSASSQIDLIQTKQTKNTTPNNERCVVVLNNGVVVRGETEANWKYAS